MQTKRQGGSGITLRKVFMTIAAAAIALSVPSQNDIHDQRAVVLVDSGPESSPTPRPPAASTQSEPRQEDILVAYKGPVEHIFFHPLIAYPELAFDNDSLSKGYNDWFITVNEFNKILYSLYKKDYILIDIRSIFEEKLENGKPVVARKEILLPKNKKPLILSIDDLNYYDYMRENGNVHKLVLDANQDIATHSVTPTGEQVIAYDNEIVPILHAFVQAHPDFSFRGAKGIIALTGYQGILGYRTHDSHAPNYENEKREALQVVKRLKETGWSFASHGYGHLDAAKVSYDHFVMDTQRWKEEVEPLIGATSVYVYPFGSKLLPGDARFEYLLASGFRVLCSVGPTPYLQATSRYIMMDRRHVDGVALRSQRSLLLDLFDAREIIDSVRPRQ